VIFPKIHISSQAKKTYCRYKPLYRRMIQKYGFVYVMEVVLIFFVHTFNKKVTHVC